MGKQIIFIDEETTHKLTLYRSDKGRIYIECGDEILTNDMSEYSGFCTLDIDDAKDLIKELERLIKEIEYGK